MESNDGVFIDDDFGLSLQQESEQIRQQQILIEKEISRIQEESRAFYQQQQQQVIIPSTSIEVDDFMLSGMNNCLSISAEVNP